MLCITIDILVNDYSNMLNFEYMFYAFYNDI